MSVINTASLIAPRKVTLHSCASVVFEQCNPCVDDSPITCCCGWQGRLADWPRHHKGLAVSRSGREADPALPWLRLPRLVGLVLT